MLPVLSSVLKTVKGQPVSAVCDIFRGAPNSTSIRQSMFQNIDCDESAVALLSC